ncbi:MAG TPA: CDP-archaeol synthase [Candidatus Poseidoniaceae archaeon]|nr:MAG: CDP-archaeol synthase [Euryarchaeota archaeon TMED141]DAC15685.1 MAG TPA: CDP-archaeol synthase [Candidatus Poseidoniales archaeon]HII97451.1 CDP-archaeol synthase [Candidatus Poseidoniaceae archaeon]|tara:strand:+ start:832 stop:1485 length:654 start_codon:yes stop_codon:yes gene_type:complete
MEGAMWGTCEESLGLAGMTLLVLWIFLPGFLVNTFAMMWGKWLPKTGYGPWPIDGGRNAWDGNRLFGDGKTWNGLIGGSLTSGLLMVLMASTVQEGQACGIFVDPLLDHDPSMSRGLWAMIVGTLLGFFSLLGDITGSFFKRRRGLKREGDISSKAPLLDTLPFAMMVFLLGWLLLPGIHGSSDLLAPIAVMLVATPVLHRSFNMLGYAIGWKDVPY